MIRPLGTRRRATAPVVVRAPGRLPESVSLRSEEWLRRFIRVWRRVARRCPTQEVFRLKWKAGWGSHRNGKERPAIARPAPHGGIPKAGRWSSMDGRAFGRTLIGLGAAGRNLSRNGRARSSMDIWLDSWKTRSWLQSVVEISIGLRALRSCGGLNPLESGGYSRRAMRRFMYFTSEQRPSGSPSHAEGCVAWSSVCRGGDRRPTAARVPGIRGLAMSDSAPRGCFGSLRSVRAGPCTRGKGEGELPCSWASSPEWKVGELREIRSLRAG